MNLTVIFMIAVVVLIAMFDIFIIAKKGKQESISAHIIRGSKKYPLMVFIAGIVAGHLLWKMADEDVYYNTKCVEVKNAD